MLPPLIATEAGIIKLIFFGLTLYWLGMAFYLGVGLSHFIGRRSAMLQTQPKLVRDWYYPLTFCLAGYIIFCLTGWLILRSLNINFIGNTVLSWPGVMLYLLQVATVSWLGPVGVIVAASLLASCILMAFNHSRWALILLATAAWLGIGLLYPVYPISRNEVSHEMFGEPFPYYTQPHPELLPTCLTNCDQNYPSVVRFQAFNGAKTSVDWQSLALSYSFMLTAMTLILWGIPKIYSYIRHLLKKGHVVTLFGRVPRFSFKHT